ncbi:uracil-xanthine permease family protein [Methanobacterium oryzae]|uniref:uracil-xanthine permease family protein n=1 Tax=Methanobacterium oryzae TaxID=69540 RepID=UPI003D1956C6
MQFKYGLNDKPKKTEMLLFGLQWLAVTIPSLIIIGDILGVFENGGIPYLQKIFLLVGVLLLVQVFWGHKLPLVMGPAAVLLIGVLTSSDQGIGAVNSSILIGGLILTFLGLTGFIKYLERLFTSRVIMVVLLLIAFTLTPTIITLISSTGSVPANYNFIFVIAFILIIFTAHAFTKGILRSLVPLIALFLGSIVYYFLFNISNIHNTNSALLAFPSNFIGHLTVPDIGIVIAFLISFLALAINDISSMESVGLMLKVDKLEERVKKGIAITGAGNFFAGLFGIIGPVNYSLSPGIIVATQNASRFTLIPAAIGILILAFSPVALTILAGIPSPVIGVIFLYLMVAQIGAAMLISTENKTIKTIDDGITVGLPVLLGIIIAFMPPSVTAGLPLVIKPIVANGFVMGALAVLILEHLLYPRNSISK